MDGRPSFSPSLRWLSWGSFSNWLSMFCSFCQSGVVHQFNVFIPVFSSFSQVFANILYSISVPDLFTPFSVLYCFIFYYSERLYFYGLHHIVFKVSALVSAGYVRTDLLQIRVIRSVLIYLFFHIVSFKHPDILAAIFVCACIA